MLNQSLVPLTRPQTTAHLAQTMSLLELSSLELRQKVEADLASNPALELTDSARCPLCNRPQPSTRPCPVCISRREPSHHDPIIFVSPSSDFSFPKVHSEDDMPLPEERTSAVEDLPSYVLKQIAPDLDPNDRSIAATILTSLDEDGLLTLRLVEIAQFHHVPISRVEKVLQLIQHAEPIGVGSPDSQSAMLVQLEVLGELKPVPEFAAETVREGLDFLSRRAYSELARFLKITPGEAEDIHKFIKANLNPFPARAHWGESYETTPSPHTYQQADILISRLKETPETPLVVEIVSPYTGSLRVNPLFREALQQAPEEKSEEWHAYMERANLLVKCLQQRNNTMIRLMQRIVVLQRNFILGGDAHLVPVTRAQLAEDLKLHESTISRAVSKKAVQLPDRRIIPMDKLFDRSLQVRTALREIIENEDRPLSDSELVGHLGEKGYHIARRTVAKYRSAEGILPARLRKSSKDQQDNGRIEKNQ